MPCVQRNHSIDQPLWCLCMTPFVTLNTPVTCFRFLNPRAMPFPATGFASLREGMLMDVLPQLSNEGWERLVVVANRLPVTCSRDAGGKWQLQVRH